MEIEYNHIAEIHTLTGPRAALPILFAHEKPLSLLDVGCGTGTWLEAALDFGIPDVFGVDGIAVPPDRLHVSPERIHQQDLTNDWNLERKFDAVICLEVAEHLDSRFAPTFIRALTNHSDRIYFSAASPRQPGQHHINCQWPAYWQDLFNDQGYICEDTLRWQMWDDGRIEPWYRQNIFVAHRAPKMAGQESRIPAVIHPEIWKLAAEMMPGQSFGDHLHQIETGSMKVRWYLTSPTRSLWAKLKRKLK
jgi:SAM-dependent methyltransferase